jgi:hypothetical protein
MEAGHAPLGEKKKEEKKRKKKTVRPRMRLASLKMTQGASSANAERSASLRVNSVLDKRRQKHSRELALGTGPS